MITFVYVGEHKIELQPGVVFIKEEDNFIHIVLKMFKNCYLISGPKPQSKCTLVQSEGNKTNSDRSLQLDVFFS